MASDLVPEHAFVPTAIIVGAGIAGLATSIALRKKGINVDVFESLPNLSEIGAGLQVPPNSARILNEWGLLQAFRNVASDTRRTILRRWDNGLVLVEGFEKDPEEMFGFPRGTLHRADYQSMLYDAAVQLGVMIHFNKRIESVNTEVPSITLSNGQTISADLVIAADGIKSHVRKDVLADYSQTFDPSTSKKISYRMLIPGETARADPLLSTFFDPPLMQVWCGPESFVICYPIQKGKAMNLLMGRTGEAAPGVWNEPGDKDLVRQEFKGFDPVVHRLLDAGGKCLKWAIAEVPQLKSWVSLSGKVVLIGDAAHAMQPMLGQGAAMAIEDAAALAECISRATKVTDIPTLSRAYAAIRMPRAQKVAEKSRANGALAMLRDGPEQEKRDRFYAKIMEKRRESMESDEKLEPGSLASNRPIPDPEAHAPSPAFNEWLYNYDVITVANEYLNKLEEYKET